MQLSINLPLVFPETCTNFLIRIQGACPSPSSLAMVCFLLFPWILCFGWVCFVPRAMCVWCTTSFPSHLFHAVFLRTHNLFYFHLSAFLIQVPFPREFPASPGLTHFSSHWPSSDSQRRISKVLRLPWESCGKLHRWHACPFVLSFPADCLLLCGVKHPHPLFTPQWGNIFRKLCESFPLPLAEDQGQRSLLTSDPS